jgi:uncharacterized protein (DUF983 family)
MSGDARQRGRDALARESNTHLPLRIPGPREAARIALRALTLRCPACGGKPVLVHWLRMRRECGACGLDLERGEGDYFIGSMMFNLVLAEFLFVAVLVAVMWVRWPTVPWDTLQVLAPLGILVAPILLYPISKLVWLGFDLALRPGTPTGQRGTRA